MLLRSTDSGAPSLTGETGALYSVLKWALPTLGWTIAFDDAANSRVAFRNSPLNGTGDYLRIADNPADHDGADARTANVRSYSSMSDVNTGTEEVGTSAWLIAKSMTADATARPWAIVGDDTYFVLLIAVGNDSFYSESYYGDIASDKPADSGVFLTQAISSTTIESFTVTAPVPMNGNASGIGFTKLRTNVAGTTVGQDAYYTQDAHSGAGTPTASSSGFIGTYPEPASGGIRVTDYLVQETAGSVIRGRLKGAMRILNNVVGEFTNFQTITNQATSRGLKNCVTVNRYSRANSNIEQGVLLFDTDHGDW